MRELIARLIECGVPRPTAVFLCRYFAKHGGLKRFEQYVEAVEGETRVRLDEV